MRIGTQDRNAFHQRLRHEQTVERVFVTCRVGQRRLTLMAISQKEAGLISTSLDAS